MLLNFDYEEKMVPTEKRLGEFDNKGKFVVQGSVARQIGVVDGDEIIVLLSNDSCSMLVGGTILQQGDDLPGYEFFVDEDVFTIMNAGDGEKVTAWITLASGQEHISVDTSVVKRVSPDPYEEADVVNGDPTGGTWLLLKTTELGYQPETNQDVKSRRVYIEKVFRDYIAFTAGCELRVIVETRGNTQEGMITYPNSSNKITIGEDIVKELGITEGGEVAHIWVDTEKIARDNSVQSSNGSVDDESTVTGAEKSHGDGELQFSTEKRDMAEMKSTATAGQSAVETTPSSDGGEVVDAESDTEPTGDDGSDGDGGGVIDAAIEQAQENQSDVSVEYVTDVTPVVLLNDEERLQEQWTGHYMDENGDVLCGVEPVGVVEDYGKEYYTEVCTECAQEKPGALDESDISTALEQFIGVSFGDEAPYVLSRENAVQLLQLLTELADGDST